MNQLRKDEGTITITHITPHTHACTIIPQQQCMFGLPSFRALFSSFLLFSSSLLFSYSSPRLFPSSLLFAHLCNGDSEYGIEELESLNGIICVHLVRLAPFLLDVHDDKDVVEDV